MEQVPIEHAPDVGLPLRSEGIAEYAGHADRPELPLRLTELLQEATVPTARQVDLLLDEDHEVVPCLSERGVEPVGGRRLTPHEDDIMRRPRVEAR